MEYTSFLVHIGHGLFSSSVERWHISDFTTFYKRTLKLIDTIRYDTLFDGSIKLRSW